MIARTALIASIAFATPATAALSPVEGATYRLVTITDRDDGTTKRHYTLTRDIVFHRTDAGLDTEVTLRAGTSKDTGAGGFYARALTKLAGTTLRFHLDKDGRGTGIDDLDRAWEALAAAVDAMAPAAQATSARRGGDLLRALPAAKRQAMLASIVAPLTQTIPADGTHSIALTGESIDRQPRRLSGQESVQRLPSGAIEMRSAASDDPAAPTTALSSRRTIDAATGLLITSEEQRTLTLPGAIAGAPARRLIITDRVTLNRLVS